ncbi:MAG TPA: carbamoyltransferase C-terminal domain-containing protein [Candidatus Limnocylindrales bacterium]|nr:carbamoyltransferase C-terminal domain-containing protein [Candidatus Limnocylindrales bacterium]
MTNSRGQDYYLSCYLSPPGEFSVLAQRHDHSVALWRRSGRQVELVRLWEVERISGQKHHAWPLYTPRRAAAFLDWLLASEDLSLADVQQVWGTPGLPKYAPLTVAAGARQFPVHSLAHLFSGLLLDTELFKTETIIGMAVDGAPDTVLDEQSPEFWYAGCMSRRGDPVFAAVESPGPLYTAASTLFHLEPGSLMALASACRSTISFDIEAAVAALRLTGGRVTPWAQAFELIRSLIDQAERQLKNHQLDSGFTRAENVRSAVMKCVQQACDLIAIRNVELLCSMGSVRPQDAYLSMSGGFALNCPTNTMLLDRFKFRGLLTPPCANDSGQALGLGLLGFYGMGAFDDAALSVASAYYGMPLRDTDATLREFAPWIEGVSDFEPGQFVADISGAVVAWVDGPAEVGPRALGHRSLLGDPRCTKVKDLLNCYKQRQWWRPVAPIVLAEYTRDWFQQDRLSPFMLEAVQVRPQVRDKVPAIVHLDGSARHQTLTASADPLLYKAIDAFRAETGVPILCNTSLNDKGEPIANSAAEALTFCISKGIHIAYIEGRRVALREPVPPGGAAVSRPRTRAVELFTGQESARDDYWDCWHRRGYTDNGIFLLAWSPGIQANNPDHAPELINKLADYYLETDDDFASLANRFRDDVGPGAFFLKPGDELPRPIIVE